MSTISDLPVINISSLNKGGKDFLDNHFSVSDTDKNLPEEISQHPTIVNAVFWGICMKGHGKIRINLNEYEINEELAFVLIPGTIIQCNLEEVSEDFLINYVSFSYEFIKSMCADTTHLYSYSSLQQHPCVRLNAESRQILIERYDELREKFQSVDNAFRIETLQYSLLADIYEFYSMYKKYALTKPETCYTESDFSRQFFDLINKYYGKERSVNFYADKLCLTPKYLSSKVKNLTGKTVYEWITESLILKAKALLKSSEMSIQELSYSFNFSDASSFGKFFKKNTGMTPNLYRKSDL